jgi:hypothetical protein
MSQLGIRHEQVDPENDLGVIVRAAELCNPFLDGLGEVTLEIRGPVAPSVLSWNTRLFNPVIRPLMEDVLREFSSGGSLEIAALDCRFDASLPAALALQSRDAGKKLTTGLLAPRGDRIVERYRDAVLAGNSPGHLAVSHALRAALFSLPPRVMLGAYLLQEGIGAGLDGRDITQFLIAGILGQAETAPLRAVSVV